MTTRRWMVVVLAVAVVLWLGIAAVRTYREGVGAYHRHAPSDGIGGTPGTSQLLGSVHISSPGSAKTTGRRGPGLVVFERGTIYHRTPFLSRYWRHLLGRQGADGYVCSAMSHAAAPREAGDRPLTAELVAGRHEFIVLEGRLISPDGLIITSDSMLWDLK
jgi:hypothetical protein